MKLRVQHEDGKIETIDIAQPISSLEGNHLNRLIGSDGTEYFFTKEGHYDGWGRGVAEANNPHARTRRELDGRSRKND
jgi:hypothetical protein